MTPIPRENQKGRNEMARRLWMIYQRREMLWMLIVKELKLKYRHSVIGFLWSFLNPLLMILVYNFVFKVVMKVGVESFPLFLVSGLLPWIFFQGSLVGAAGSILSGANLVKKVAFPREILPLAMIGANFISFLATLVVLLITVSTVEPVLSWSLLELPVVLLLHLAFTVGVGLTLATLTVFFRDTSHLLEVVLMIWFYMTPVIYPKEMVPKSFVGWMLFNPMAVFIESYRTLILHGDWLRAATIAQMAGFALVAVILGMYSFRKYQGRFAEEV